MKEHALVVGSPGSPGTSGQLLQGVEHDAEAVTAMLRQRGFEVAICAGPDATRDGILAAYDKLIADVGDGDAAVLYYSGHGFYAVVEHEAGKAWQGIVPVDLSQSTEDDFRGITSWELSIKQAQLVQKTRNVTVILDCCHSAQMSRDGAVRRAVPRALPHPLRRGFAAHLDALRARYGAAFDAVDPTGNPHAVRLVACGQTESAYEYLTESGRYRGAFTEALLDVLDEVGDIEIDWATVIAATAARVLRSFVNQRPAIEGPARRRLFSVIEGDDRGGAAITATGGGFRIGAGRLAGVQRGDVYGAMPRGSTAFERARAIAELEIEQVAVASAEARLRAWSSGHASMPEDAVAFPIERQAVQWPVALDAPAAERPAIEEAIAASRRLRIAAPGERGALATLRLAGGDLTIEDPDGPLFPPMRSPGELLLVVQNLANLGAARSLRELEGEHGVHASEVEIEWGTVDRGEPRRMPERGCAIGLRDRLYVALQSKAQRPLFAHIFNIGLRGRIALLTKFAPLGLALGGGEAPVFLGRRPDGTLHGVGLFWPPGMPTATFPRLDEIVVIVTTAKVNLQHLEAAEQLGGWRSLDPRQSDLLAQLGDGRAGERDDAAPMEGFLVKRLSFFLHPLDAAMADIPFEIDEDPLRQAGALSPEAWLSSRPGALPPPRPQGLAIRIADLAVEERALGEADLRVDALICTRSASEAGSLVAWTRRFPRSGEGEPPALDEALLFHGPACDFIDICLWISRDAEGSLELAELLAGRAASADHKAAAGALRLGDGATPAPWVTAVGASSAFARMARDLLYGVAGESIGLYRTSLAAHERFGAGRHPAGGLHRTRGVSFSLVIEPIEPAPVIEAIS